MWVDRFIRALLLFLLLFTPLAFGSVHAWAYSLVEGTVALLVAAWAVRIWSLRNSGDIWFNGRVWPYALPLALFIGFVFLQMAPFPPSVLRAVSPATYELYSEALPGWPERTPYAELRGHVEEERGSKSEHAEDGRREGSFAVFSFSCIRRPGCCLTRTIGMRSPL